MIFCMCPLQTNLNAKIDLIRVYLEKFLSKDWIKRNATNRSVSNTGVFVLTIHWHFHRVCNIITNNRLLQRYACPRKQIKKKNATDTQKTLYL